jgi:excisionase family DNA binding protein
MEHKEQEQHLRMSEVCRMLGMNRMTVRDMIWRDELPGAYQLNQRGDWRIPLSSVHEWLRKRREAIEPKAFGAHYKKDEHSSAEKPKKVLETRQ